VNRQQLEKTLDEHIAWVKQATELGIAEGAPGIKRAIDALTDEQLRGMIFVLVSERASSVSTLRELAREQFDRLDTRGGSVTLN
jgi:hypothetical protein